MRSILGFFLSISLLAAVCVGNCGAQTTPDFRAGEYEGPQYTTSDQVEDWKGVRVRITQVKFTPADHSGDPWPFMCRAWISVSTPQHNHKLYFEDIEAMGLSYGLFLPSQQPSAHHLLILKVGDYDGHMILVRNNGLVSDIHGEGYVVDNKRELLFTTHAEHDQLKLLVFDLASDRVVFDKPIPALQSWYQDDSYGIVFTVHNEQVAGKEDRNGVYMFDAKSQKLDYVTTSVSDFSNLKPISYAFDESLFQDCTSPTSRRKLK